jgi:hypothetical protein
MTEHQCKKCLKLLPVSEFAKNKTYKLGITNQCKGCHKIWAREFYKKNQEELRTKMRLAYTPRPPRIKIVHDPLAAREAISKKNKLQRLRNKELMKFGNERSQYYKEKSKIASIKQRLAHPKKHKARRVVSNAIRDGKMVRVLHCKVCNAEGAQAHHPDYSKPLDVLWLCNKHHMAWHRVFIADE